MWPSSLLVMEVTRADSSLVSSSWLMLVRTSNTSVRSTRPSREWVVICCSVMRGSSLDPSRTSSTQMPSRLALSPETCVMVLLENNYLI